MSSFGHRRAARSVFALAAMLMLAVPAAAQLVGIAAAVRNQASAKTARDTALRPIRLKEGISLGDDIATGKASALQLLLRDRTVFTIGGNARIKVDRFVYDPDRNSSTVAISVVKGAFRFMSGKATHANPGQAAVHTPVAVIGIRGTIFEGAVGAEALAIARKEAIGRQIGKADVAVATLVILRGPGASAQGGTQPGAIDVVTNGVTVALTSPGMALFVPAAGRAPIGPFQISDRGLSALQADLLGAPAQIRTETNLQVAPATAVDLYLPTPPLEGQPPGP